MASEFSNFLNDQELCSAKPLPPLYTGVGDVCSLERCIKMAHTRGLHT